MDAVFLELREIARKIVAGYPQPDFYADHPSEVRASRQFYQTDDSILRLRREMADCLDNDFGHGMGHVEKVAVDAGTLAIIESRLAGHTQRLVRRNLLLAQCAGMLHDIHRKEEYHAEKGAQTARTILKSYPLVAEEIAQVCAAIRNHEAFAHPQRLPAPRTHIISDCLYDADKFRWGPDNFSHTIWDMVGFSNATLEAFADHFPQGMALLKKIRGTFRSGTGRCYGPQFIDMGIAIGEMLYDIILTEFLHRE
jgi:HD domain